MKPDLPDSDGESSGSTALDPTGLPLQFDPQARSQGPKRGLGGVLMRRAVYLPLVMLLVFTGAVVGMYFQPPGLKRFFGLTGLEPGGGSSDPIAVPVTSARAETDDTTVSETDVVGLGKLVPRGDVVTLALPFGAGDARIDSIEVQIGQRVVKGQLLAVLDNLDELDSVVKTAEATVAIREATLEQTRKSVTSSRAETKASIRRLTTAADEAKAELKRTQSLFDRALATQQELDQARSRSSQAHTEIEGAKATLARYGDRNIGSQADVLVALRNLESVRSDLDRAKRELSKAQVLAPSDGVVLDIHARPGERPGASGVLSLAEIDEMTAEVEIFQELIGRVHVGDAVEIIADALASRLTGTVQRIGLEVGKQTMIDDDPAANTDARVVTVFVKLDAQWSAAARPFTNLQVVARIRVGGSDP